MALFFSQRDIGLFKSMNKELLSDVIEQKIGYYKLSLEDSNTNIYGETKDQKNFLQPVLLSCLITSGDFSNAEYNELRNVRRGNGFAFLKDHLIEAGIFPESWEVIRVPSVAPYL